MELDELRNSWNEQARKLDRVLSLNLHNFKTTQLDRTRSALDRFKTYLVFELLVGVGLLLGLGSYIADRISTPTLAIPALIIGLSALVAVIGDIRELILIAQISYAEAVTVIQRKLGEIRLHFLRTIRLMILMLPLYMVYIAVGTNLLFGWDILRYGNRAFLWVNLLVSLIFIAPAIWIFRNLSFDRINHPVIRALLQGSGGKQMIAAMEFLKALQEFERPEVTASA